LSPAYFDRAGQPIDLWRWAELHEDMANIRVAETTVGDLWVSTVWFGLNHQFGDGPPLIFETMVFERADTGSEYEGYCQRYATEAEARTGHNSTVILLEYDAMYRRSPAEPDRHDTRD